MFLKRVHPIVLKVIMLILMVQTLLLSDELTAEKNISKRDNQVTENRTKLSSENHSQSKSILLESLGTKSQILLLVLISLIGLFFLRNEFDDSLTE